MEKIIAIQLISKGSFTTEIIVNGKREKKTFSGRNRETYHVTESVYKNHLVGSGMFRSLGEVKSPKK